MESWDPYYLFGIKFRILQHLSSRTNDLTLSIVLNSIPFRITMEYLTSNAVTTMVNTPKADGQQPVTVQVINVKAVTSGQGDRYRVVMSDGQHYVQGMLASQLNYLAETQALQINCLLEVTDFMTNSVGGKKTIVILLNARVLTNVGSHSRLGSPTEIQGTPGAPGASAAQPLYNSTNNNPPQQQQETKPKPYGNNHSSNNTNSNAMNISPSNPYGAARPNAATSHAPIVRSTADSQIYTQISDLNLYQSRWTIKARVTLKSDIKTWQNAKGEGSLFSVELLDKSGTDIRGTFFKEGVDKWYGVLEEGKVYTFSGGRLKVANARYNNCKSQHEITFDHNSEIHLMDDQGVQSLNYDFVQSIASIEAMGIEQERINQVDVLAYVQAIGDVQSFVSKKSGKEMTKCEITLVDDSNAQITMAIWGDQAHKAVNTIPLHEIVAVRRARLSEFNGGKSLSSGSVITARTDPSIQQLPAFGRLQQWYQQTGGQGARSLSAAVGGYGQPASLSERKQIADIKREGLGYQNEKGDYISFKATVSFFKKDKEGGAWYCACPNAEEPCKNRYKVVPTATGAGEQWSCEKCNGTYDRCVRRWIFSGVIEDPSGSTWVSFFNESAEILFDGKTADEIYQAGEGAQSDAYDSVFHKALYKEYIFKCKVKNELVNEENRLKTSVQSIAPVDYVKESKELLAAIAQF